MTGLVTIIPGLVSAETDIRSLRGFALSPDFRFFPPPPTTLPLHYRIEKGPLPPVTGGTVRSGWYSWEDGILSYDRPFFTGRLGMRVDRRQIRITPGFLRIPFSIGGIRTAGELLFGRMTWDLFNAGWMVLRGCAWQSGAGRVSILVMPGMNGKTSLVYEILSRDPAASLISEDILVCKPGPEGLEVVPTAPFFNNQGRKPNARLAACANRICTPTAPLIAGEVYYATNSLSADPWRARESLDFALTNGLFFLHDPMVSLEMLVTGSVSAVFERIKTGFAAIGGQILAGQNYNLAGILSQTTRG